MFLFSFGIWVVVIIVSIIVLIFLSYKIFFQLNLLKVVLYDLNID